MIELLVVLGVVAVLVGILLPALGRAKRSARVVHAHADLRSISQSLLIYQDDHEGDLPPTRFSCSSGAVFPLPVELARGGYLQITEGDQQTLFEDVFSLEPGQSYKYRAPGPAWVNTSTYLPDGSWLWVPDDAPVCGSVAGRWVNDREGAVVRYAAWSVGPDSDRPGEVEANKHPLPRAAWYGRELSGGLITHYQADTGLIYTSP